MLNTQGLSPEEVKINMIDFITGGIFTVSNTLVYLFYHLAANQNVQQKLFDEIHSVLCDNDNGDSTSSPNCIDTRHLSRMTYLKSCVRECFRLNCPVPGIMRVTSKPLVLSGYNIPENVSHLVTQYF